MSTMAARMKELRNSRNLTIYAMADIIGVSAATISRYENGKIDPHKSSIEKYSRYFRINPLWLIGVSEDQEEAPKESAPMQLSIFDKVNADNDQKNVVGYTWADINDDVDFALKMPDDSMKNARILKNDIILVKTQSTIQHGEIAVVTHQGETMVRRIQKVRSLVVLHPENPEFPDGIYKLERSCEIKVIGKVKYVRHEVI